LVSFSQSAQKLWTAQVNHCIQREYLGCSTPQAFHLLNYPAQRKISGADNLIINGSAARCVINYEISIEYFTYAD
jgi:hypothetical protein